MKLDKTALAHYGKFLEGTKKYLSSANQAEGRRLAMVSCLLIICIENMQYRPHNALAHAKQVGDFWVISTSFGLRFKIPISPRHLLTQASSA